MKDRKICHAPPPKRKELTENPVKLCHDISRAFHSRIREGAELEGVMSQPGARLVLSFLAVGDGINQRQLVEATRLRAPTVSAILHKMEEEGMVERRQSEGDRREMKVYLTEYGRETDRQGIEKIKKYDALALRGLDESEIELLFGLLERVRKNLLELPEEESAESGS